MRRVAQFDRRDREVLGSLGARAGRSVTTSMPACDLLRSGGNEAVAAGPETGWVASIRKR